MGQCTVLSVLYCQYCTVRTVLYYTVRYCAVVSLSCVCSYKSDLLCNVCNDNIVKCDAVLYSNVHCSTVLYNAVYHCTNESSVLFCFTVLYCISLYCSNENTRSTT